MGDICIYRKKKNLILKPKPKIQGKGIATVIGVGLYDYIITVVIKLQLHRSH